MDSLFNVYAELARYPAVVAELNKQAAAAKTAKLYGALFPKKESTK
jgi:hypothetical protein